MSDYVNIYSSYNRSSPISQSQSLIRVEAGVERQTSAKIDQTATTTASSTNAASSWSQKVREPADVIRVESEDNSTYAYSVKIVNPSRMKDFHTIDLGTGGAFRSMKLLKQFISKKIPDVIKVDLQNVEMGYVEPGHGMKGKKVWLYTDGDLGNMYERYQGKPTIRLWCYSTPISHASKPPASTSLSQDENQQKDVNEIYEELQKKHTGAYTPEQLRAWSHMIRLKTHDSLDTLPDKPFFRGYKRKTIADSHSPSAKAPESKRRDVPTAISPGKKLNMRSELINQLEKWHNLLDSCVITQHDYDDLKDKILSDIKQL